MSPFELCKTYIGLKNHFTTKTYNYFLRGPVPIKIETYKKRPDTLHFEKWAHHPDPIGLIIANYIETGKFPWIGHLDENHFRAWKKRIESFSYYLKKDLTKFEDPFIINLKVVDGQLPPFIRMTFRGEISIETACWLLEETDTISYFDKKIGKDPNWKRLSEIHRKYFPYLKHRYDRQAALEVFKSMFEI